MVDVVTAAGEVARVRVLPRCRDGRRDDLAGVLEEKRASWHVLQKPHAPPPLRGHRHNAHAILDLWNQEEGKEGKGRKRGERGEREGNARAKPS